MAHGSEPIDATSPANEKAVPSFREHERERDSLGAHQDLFEHGFAADSDELPKGYFTSTYFLGSLIAIGFNLMASTGGFALVAPGLGQIDVAIGPGPVIWLSFVSSYHHTDILV